MNFKDFYKVLGVKPDASQSDIKTAYRKLSKKFHPDVNNGDPFFEERFKEIQEAYETLSDLYRRKQYDDLFKAEETSEKPSGNSQPKEEPFRQPNQNKESRPSGFATKKTPGRFSIYRFLTLLFVCIALTLFRASMNKSIVLKAENSYNSQLSANPSPVYPNPETKAVIAKDSGMSIKPEADNRVSGIILKYKNKIISVDSFPLNLDIDVSGPLKKTFRDLDMDGTPEIITEYWSGGAHCCNINDVFTLDSDGIYKNIFEYSGDITVDRNKVILDFSETMGYFLSCYNCNIEDSLPKSNFRPEINLIYTNQQFFLAPNNPYVDYGLTEDLVQLYYRNIPRLDAMQFDDGTRKAFASRIICYYFNHGADLQKSKDLFYKYYPGNDKDFVWNKINDYLKGLNADLSPYVLF